MTDDKKERRERIATACLAALLGDSVSIANLSSRASAEGLHLGTVAARTAIQAADSLIAELDRA